jgi:ABC transporter substrate binding protein
MQTIPIVFVNVSEPVVQSIVARLDRPSGSTTGFANSEVTLGGKWLELLSEIAPGLKRAANMFNPDTAPHNGLRPASDVDQGVSLPYTASRNAGMVSPCTTTVNNTTA